jgi:hypothetical protein
MASGSAGVTLPQFRYVAHLMPAPGGLLHFIDTEWLIIWNIGKV